jgi:hypothetical protein
MKEKLVSKVYKMVAPFSVPKRMLDFIDALVLLSQFGLTKTRYKSRTEFLVTAMRKEAQALYDEYTADITVAPMLADLLGGEDATCLNS